MILSQEEANNDVLTNENKPKLLPLDGKVEALGEVDQWGFWHSSIVLLLGQRYGKTLLHHWGVIQSVVLIFP